MFKVQKNQELRNSMTIKFYNIINKVVIKVVIVLLDSKQKIHQL